MSDVKFLALTTEESDVVLEALDIAYQTLETEEALETVKRIVGRLNRVLKLP